MSKQATVVKAGIIGLGRLGSRHARHLVEKIQGIDLIAACALDDEQLKWAHDDLGVANTYKDYKEMIDKEDIDAVFIVAPTPFHPEMTIYAMNAGLNVFCEKPLGLDLNEVNKMAEVINRHPKQVFQSGFMRRYDESYRYAKKLVDEGKIGKIIYMRGYGIDPISGMESFTKFATEADSGGIFVDMNIHDVDLIRWFTHQEPVQAYGITSNIAAPELEKIGEFETGVAQLKMDGGVIATLIGGRHAAHGNQVELEIMGSDGWLRVGEHPDLNRVTVFSENGVTKPSLQSFGERFDNAFTDEVQDFVHNVEQGTQPEVTVEDGIKALKIAKACQESANEGQLVNIKL
ncbi:Gfo/Idh/MocA family oxidoreductase [Companilactobacillus ginsenosidimutans]|uniref:Myo-inositol 2-dehydrogenase n=1 Tax=Companilactobacillus ginsenosidimutans TaxID=1007676 RepID=A0A0H4QME8_9LACO|nr:Gfo/Idh/MocA family oxidoreductase [Companilactobacillus ginsenosidimutans]AKP67873.1 myo-inositol 2-dehydrogenase [Companilactobacillus ginsenosidimutans]